MSEWQQQWDHLPLTAVERVMGHVFYGRSWFCAHCNVSRMTVADRRIDCVRAETTETA
jgi:hypothetical protein